MIWVRKLMGWVLVGMAAHFLGPILPAGCHTILLAVVAAAAGLHLGWLERSPATFAAFPLIRGGVGILALVFATILFTTLLLRGQGVAWRPYSEAEVAAARDLGKPVIIDFSAAWCTPCRELEEITFHHPEVVALAGKSFIMVKVDVTKGDNPLHQELLKRYQVKGVPTLIFLDATGQERSDLRLVDFLPAEQILPRMQAVITSGQQQP